MTIRPAREADIPCLVEMMLANWDTVMAEHHSAAVVEKFRAEITPDWIRRQMAWKQVFIVEESGDIVATGSLANFGTGNAPKHSVSQFFVRADLHRREIGTHLLRHLIQVARSGGARPPWSQQSQRHRLLPACRVRCRSSTTGRVR